MPLHDKAFWIIFFFLAGVLLYSGIRGETQWFLFVLLSTALIFIVLSIFSVMNHSPRAGWLGLFSIFIIVGGLYTAWFDMRRADISVPFDRAGTYEGIITAASYGTNVQTLTVELNSPLKGTIQVAADQSPRYSYGDRISLTSTITMPPSGKEGYFLKQGFAGEAAFPRVTLLASHVGNPMRERLFKIKIGAEDIIQNALPRRTSGFLTGILLGDTATLDKGFKQEMKQTGTTHIVALSGYNISILATSIAFLLALWCGRRLTFVLSTFVIILFVVMTGAEASVVRAAIMGIFVLLADQVARVYSFRNAIAIAAFLMVLVNPFVLRWDVGFQLSFAAVMGLVYVRPPIQRAFRMSQDKGFLGWRENFLATLSAQLAVLPILLMQFGMFAPVSILTNILVLVVVPLTMAAGFGVVLVGMASLFLARIVGIIPHILLSYAMGIIDVAAKLPGVIQVQNLGLWFAFLYYPLLIGFVRFMRYREKKRSYALTF